MPVFPASKDPAFSLVEKPRGVLMLSANMYMSVTNDNMLKNAGHQSVLFFPVEKEAGKCKKQFVIKVQEYLDA
jgi:hypothetical protein